MSVICKNKFGFIITVIDCDDMEEALSVARSWETIAEVKERINHAWSDDEY